MNYNKKDYPVADDLPPCPTPAKHRECTDLFCIIIITGAICGMYAVAYLGYVCNGDPYKLAFGMDSWGNICNRNNNPIKGANFSGQNLVGNNLLIWMLIIGCVLGSIVISIFLWDRWYKNAYSDNSNKIGQAQSWMVVAIISTSLSVSLTLLLLVMRDRIGLVVQLFREASRTIKHMPLLMLQPMFTIVCLMLVITLMASAFVFILTAAMYVVDTQTGLVASAPLHPLELMKWYYLFGCIWVIQFIFACHQLVIAGAVSIWYFTIDKQDLERPISDAVTNLMYFHLGSAAFGALIIAILQVIQKFIFFVLMRIQKVAKNKAVFILKCITYALWIFEVLFKFINKNAYIMIALYGFNFCTSTKRAFNLLLTHAVSVVAINSVGTFVLLLAKLGVSIIPIIVGIHILEDKPDVCYVIVPLLAVTVASLIVGHVFMSVHAMIIDTIFLCFCEDCDRNDGIERPYAMSVGLMKYVANASEAFKVMQSGKKVKR